MHCSEFFSSTSREISYNAMCRKRLDYVVHGLTNEHEDLWRLNCSREIVDIFL